VTVLPPLPAGLDECSVAFTDHAVVATALTDRAVHDQKPDGFGASLSPDFLRHLAGPNGWIGVTDATLTARGTGGSPRLQPLTDALLLVRKGEPVFAAVSPGSARSLRAFLACGFTPIGSEVVLRPEREYPTATLR
jgi:hypothetical protein